MFLRAFYDKQTGNGLHWYSYTGGSYRIPTFEQDYEAVTVLSERKRDTIGYKDFTNGEYMQDFAESDGFRVNLQTDELEFSYPEPNQTEPVYQAPLSDQIAELKQQNTKIMLALAELSAAVMGGSESG